MAQQILLVVFSRRELGIISELLTKENLSKNEAFGFSKSLDAPALQKLFNEIARKYCTIIMEWTQSKCEATFSGCGLSGVCGFDETCVNDQKANSGYVCKRKCFSINYCILLGIETSHFLWQNGCFFKKELKTFRLKTCNYRRGTDITDGYLGN